MSQRTPRKKPQRLQGKAEIQRLVEGFGGTIADAPFKHLKPRTQETK